MKYAVPGLIATLLVPSTVWAVTPPYLETFDSQTTCGALCTTVCPMTNGWTNPTDDSMDWLVHAGTTTSSGTGPSGDHTTGTGKYLYAETSGTACNNTPAHLVSPDFDLTMSGVVLLEFWYHMFGAAQGMMHVDVDPDGGGNGPWTLDIIPPWTDNIDLWQLKTVDLTPYAGTTINVRIRGVMGTTFTSDMAVDDFRLYEVLGDDLGVESIDTPLGGCALSAAESVTVTVTNYGSTPQTGFYVWYTVNGGAPVVETFTGTLGPLASVPFTFATTVDMSGAGPFTLNAGTALPTDQDTGNDTAPTRVITPLGNTIATFPHINDFESGVGDWYSHGVNNTWAFGTPAKSVIQGAASGINAWVNGGLTGTYLNDDVSYVETRCGYDFTNVNYPAVRFRAWWSTEQNYDRARLQASTDDGQTWQTVGLFGDPVNWYNAAQHAWHGEAGGYVTVAHELQAYANQPLVRFRIQFTSDFTVVRNGFAFDDFEIFDNTPQLNVLDASPPVSASSIAPGSLDVVTQTLRIDARGNTAIDVDAITVALSGTLPETDVVSVNLWVDDGDALFEAASDMLIGSEVFAGNAATFGGLAANLALPPLEASWVHITVDLQPTALQGATFATSIQNESDIVPVSMVPVVFDTVPLSGPELSILDAVSDLPYVEDYDGVPVRNRLANAAAGQYYPTAAARGPVVGRSPSPSPNPGRVDIIDQVDDGAGGFITPLSPPLMSAFSFPYGGAAAALDYWFDLSQYSAERDLLWLTFSWNNASMNNHDLNNVFISTNAADTWDASLYRFDFSTPVPPGWHDEVVEISSMLRAAAADFSSTTVLRFQAFGLADFPTDGLTLDNVWVGIPQYARIHREPGLYLGSGGIDAVNGLGTGPITLTYTLNNASHRPLDLGEITTSLHTGVRNVTVTPAVLPTPMNPEDVVTFEVSFEADIEDWSFQLEFPTNDPRALGGLYTLSVIGNHGPRMDVERLPGISIPHGGVNDVGLFAEGEYVLQYTIFNRGDVVLNLTNLPEPVTIANLENIEAVITEQPVVTTLAPGESSGFQITFSGVPGTDFRFDMSIENDDPEQAPYAFTVVGTTLGGDMPDAGPGPDAPVEPDAGVDPPDPGEDCGCQVGRAPSERPPVTLFLFLALLSGLYLARRRQRSSVRE